MPKKKRRSSRKSYPGHLERHGAGYRAIFTIDGQRHRVTLATVDRETAEDMAREEYKNVRARAQRVEAGLPGTMKMSAVLDEFEEKDMPPAPNAQRAYRDSLKPIRAYFVDRIGNPLVDRIDGPTVQRFLDWRRVNRMGKTGRSVSARTVEKDRAVLHRIFERAERRGYRQGNPVRFTEPPKADKREPVILNAEQFERLLAGCAHNPMLGMYVLTLAETGLRAESEALRLRWEDLDLDDDVGFLRVVSGRDGHRTKSGKGRSVPMTPRLRSALLEHRMRYMGARYDGKPSPWVFHHLVTRRHHKAGQRVQSFYDAFKGAVKRQKLPAELVQHDLRHRRVTVWLAEGKSPMLVRDAMGHSDMRVTQGYTHLVRDHLRGLVDEPSRTGTDSKTG